MQYIYPDSICPYCGKHTSYNSTKLICFIDVETCQNCNKKFRSIATRINVINMDEDSFWRFETEKIKEDKNG